MGDTILAVFAPSCRFVDALQLRCKVFQSAERCRGRHKTNKALRYKRKAARHGRTPRSTRSADSGYQLCRAEAESDQRQRCRYLSR